MQIMESMLDLTDAAEAGNGIQPLAAESARPGNVSFATAPPGFNDLLVLQQDMDNALAIPDHPDDLETEAGDLPTEPSFGQTFPDSLPITWELLGEDELAPPLLVGAPPVPSGAQTSDILERVESGPPRGQQPGGAPFAGSPLEYTLKRIPSNQFLPLNERQDTRSTVTENSQGVQLAAPRDIASSILAVRELSIGALSTGDTAVPSAPAIGQAKTLLSERNIASLSSGISWLIANSRSTATLRLSPPEVGQLLIQVHSQGDSARVMIVAPSQEIQNSILDTGRMLRDLLAQDKIELTELQVGLRDRGAGESRPDTGHGQPNGSRLTPSRTDSLFNEKDAIQEGSPIQHEVSSGMIDYYA